MACRSCEGSEGDDIEATPLAGGVLRQKRRRSRPLRAPRQRGSWKALGARIRSNRKPNKKVTSPSFFSFDLVTHTCNSWCSVCFMNSFPLPPRLLRGNPKASRWIRSGPKPLSSSSPGKEFREVGNPSALLKSSSACDTHDSASIVERRNRRVSYCSKNEYPSPPPSSNVHHHRTNISWKTNQKKEGDSKFLFKEVQPEESRPSSRSDSRTTVMIRNIPNKYRLAYSFLISSHNASSLTNEWLGGAVGSCF